MEVLRWKICGFLYTLLALVSVCVFAKDLPYGEIVIGGLIAILTAQARDLYRKETNEIGGNHVNTKGSP